MLKTAFYTIPFGNLVAEALFPKQFYLSHIPALGCQPAQGQDHCDELGTDVQAFGLVTKALNRSQWSTDPRAFGSHRERVPRTTLERDMG